MGIVKNIANTIILNRKGTYFSGMLPSNLKIKANHTETMIKTMSVVTKNKVLFNAVFLSRLNIFQYFFKMLDYKFNVFFL